MANEASIISALISILFLMGIHHQLKKYFLDDGRQDLFVIRDKLFDMAAAGDISFSSPAYRASRAFINDMIRYGHHLSALDCMWAAHICKDKSKRGQTKVDALKLREIRNKNVRAQVEVLADAAIMRMTKMLVLRSVGLSLTILPVYLLLKLLDGKHADAWLHSVARAVVTGVLANSKAELITEEVLAFR